MNSLEVGGSNPLMVPPLELRAFFELELLRGNDAAVLRMLANSTRGNIDAATAHALGEK